MFTLFPPVRISSFRPQRRNTKLYKWARIIPYTFMDIKLSLTNPLSLRLYNTPYDNELCSTELYLLTTALTPKQFTQIGYKQSLIKVTAPKSNEYTIDYYDHDIIRPNEDTFLHDDPFANPQLTEKFFIKTPDVITLNTLDKNTTASFQQHAAIFMLLIDTLTNLTTFH